MGDLPIDPPSRKEDLEPPTPATIQLIKQRVTARWPKLNVGVLWVWVGGQKRLAFKWDHKLGRHVLAKKFNPDDKRILCAMSYSGLIDEIDVLNEAQNRGGKR